MSLCPRCLVAPRPPERNYCRSCTNEYSREDYRKHRLERLARASHARRRRGQLTLEQVQAIRAAARVRSCHKCPTPANPGSWYCDSHQPPPSNTELLARRCFECDVPFNTRYLRQRFCSEACARIESKRRRHRANTARHFPRIRYGPRQAIFERDGWRCGICRAAIDPTLKYPHPGFASVDHIDPNGPHHPCNWQATHFLCNIEKGRKAA